MKQIGGKVYINGMGLPQMSKVWGKAILLM